MNPILHTFFKYLYLIAVKIYYSKVTVLNIHKLPKNTPVLIALNHSNAFWDAVVVGVHTKQPMWFLARGDVFNKPLAAKFLTAIGVAPIYRMQEGYDNLDKNQAVFNRCYQLLGDNAYISIFPEGNCERESKLRPLKKGTARIAFGALDFNKEGLPLQIVCAGINYDEPDNLNSELSINFNDAIDVQAFYEDYKTSAALGINKLTTQIKVKLDEVMINIHSREHLPLFHFIKRNFISHIVPSKISEQEQFDVLKLFSEKFNHYNEQSNAHFIAMQDAANSYAKTLQALSLREKYVNRFVVHKKFLIDYFLFLLLLLPALLGLLFNSWPYFAANKLAKKVVKKPEFFVSLNAGSATIFYLVWYVLCFFIFLIFVPFLKAVSLIVLIHVSGLIALHLSRYFRAIKAHFKIIGIQFKNKNTLKTLVEQREKCIQSIINFNKA